MDVQQFKTLISVLKQERQLSSTLGTLSWNNVVDFGADPTRSLYSDTAFGDAYDSLPADGGIIYLPFGTYKTLDTWTVPKANVTIITDPGTVIYHYGSGPCIRMYSPLAYTSGWGGGVLGAIVDGSNASPGACGVQLGDIYQMKLDFTSRFFQGSGSKGIWFDNQYFWAEQMRGRVFAQQNTSNVVFDNSANVSGSATGSYKGTLLDVVLDCKGVGDGVILQNGAVLYNHRLGIYGNMDYSPSTKRWALTITGSKAGQFSRIQAGEVYVGMEVNGISGTQPGTINFGAAGSNYLRACKGVMDFGAASAFAGANNWDGSFQFDGPVLGDVNLKRSNGVATAHFSAGAISNGGFITTRFDSIVQAFPSSNVTGVILGTGDPGLSGTGSADQIVTVVNTGSGSITFAAAATSHVATGTSCVIPPGTAMMFVWVANSSTWYPQTIGAS
jgi:hypothetical protein